MHTKEPWEFDQYGNVKKDGETIRTMGFALSNCKTSVANARRIVACVNACVGLKTEELEGITILSEHGVNFHDSAMRVVEKQRDELLAALIMAGAVLEQWNGCCTEDVAATFCCDDELAVIDAVIAKQKA